MPISLSDSGWHIIRGASRLILPLLGMGIILAMLYAYTEWATKATEEKALPVQLPDYLTMLEAPGAPLVVYQFPYPTELDSIDGRSLQTTLTARPSKNEITFTRHRDKAVFTIHIRKLSSESRGLVEKFPIAGSQLNLTPFLAERVFPLLPNYLNPATDLPYSCTLRSREGKTVSVTLLERPSARLIKFRRKADQRVFTIPIDQLIKSDQLLIERFAVRQTL